MSVSVTERVREGSEIKDTTLPVMATNSATMTVRWTVG